MKKITFLGPVLAAIVLSGTAFASNPYDIHITRVTGTGCPDPSLVSVEVNPLGEYVIIARFNQNQDVFIAESSQTRTTARVDCIIDYNLVLDSRYKLGEASFQIDGQYNLSETGTAFYSIRHNVPGLANPTYENVSYSALRGDNPDDNFILKGFIEGIDERVNQCGAVIPLEVQLRATARQARTDQLTTFVAVDNGEGNVRAERGYRQIKCQARPVPCF